MPTYNGVFHEPNGKLAPQGLIAMGPFIAIQIEVPQALAESLQKSGLPIPTPVEGIALIDTGATMTSINAEVMTGLGIQPVGIANIGTAGGPQKQSTFPVKFSFPGTPLPAFELPGAIGCNLTGQAGLNGRPMIALIGRDVLSRAVLVYNGSLGTFSLSF